MFYIFIFIIIFLNIPHVTLALLMENMSDFFDIYCVHLISMVRGVFSYILEGLGSCWGNFMGYFGRVHYIEVFV